MKTFTEQELKEILRKHKLWLEDSDQQDAECANLSGAYLSGADLSCANLSCADLSGANLSCAYLLCADLSGANLSCADLSGAYLSCADLSCANLSCAYLSGAYLSCADLSCANLSCAKNIPFIPYACPDFGSFIGYKKAQGLIVELEILSDAKRVSATGRKCRCDKAKVLSIQNIDGTPSVFTSVASGRDSKFIYKVGEIVTVDDFDENRWNECSTGIHFFINRQEAVNY